LVSSNMIDRGCAADGKRRSWAAAAVARETRVRSNLL
jgi:hypothetical protein